MVAYFKDQKSMCRHCKNLLDLPSEVKLDLQPICITESSSKAICVFSYNLVLMLMPKDRISNYRKRLLLKSLLSTMNSEIFKEKDQIG